jgi:hypothetical protein
MPALIVKYLSKQIIDRNKSEFLNLSISLLLPEIYISKARVLKIFGATKKTFKVGDEIAGIKIQRIKHGTNGEKIFVIGTDMKDRITPFAQSLEKQGYKVELFNEKYAPFKIDGGNYTWEQIQGNWDVMMQEKYSGKNWVPYDDPNALKNIQGTLMYRANQQFIQKALNEGTIIDVGKTYDSHFYDMEIFNVFN